MTNREKLNLMNNYELASLICDYCEQCILKKGYPLTAKTKEHGIQALFKVLEYEDNCTKSADEMFKELEYEHTFSDRNGCNYYIKKKEYKKVVISIVCNPSNTYYSKYALVKDNEEEYKGILWENITEAEDKAIHKKIEELRKES